MEDEAKKLRSLFQAYLEKDSMLQAARESEMILNHSSIKHLLTNEKYLGDGDYPKIIEEGIFKKVQEKIAHRARVLGRTDRVKGEKKRIHPTNFTFEEKEVQIDCPFQRANYLYTCIKEVEDER